MNLISMLVEDEGIELKPYKDTLGNWTIGVGRNLDDNGITYAEAMLLLQNDIARSTKEAEGFWWYDQLDPVRRDVVVMMIFNMGLPTFKGFRRMIKALGDGAFSVAAHEMLDSHWAEQVGNRAKRLAQMMGTGQYPDEDDTVP